MLSIWFGMFFSFEACSDCNRQNKTVSILPRVRRLMAAPAFYEDLCESVILC